MVGDTLEVEAWKAKAACRGSDVGQFFPTDRGRGRPKSPMICDGCTVKGECFDYVLSFGTNQPGVWGGTTEQDRKRLRGVSR